MNDMTVTDVISDDTSDIANDIPTNDTGAIHSGAVTEIEDIECDTDNTDVPAEDGESADNSEKAETDGDGEADGIISSLQEEIIKLKQKISDLESEREGQLRMLREVSDFTDLFPDVELTAIPECVWDTVRNGSSLPAAYALYERRQAAEARRIQSINAKNAASSAGVAGRDLGREFFTPEDVKKMSRAEVHANYHKIKESMKKWINN